MECADETTCHAWTGQAFVGTQMVKIRGNNIADELARKDAEKTPVGSKPIIGVTQQHVKAIRGNVFQEYSCRGG